MPQRTEGKETGGDQVRLPAGVVLKPAVSEGHLTRINDILMNLMEAKQRTRGGG